MALYNLTPEDNPALQFAMTPHDHLAMRVEKLFNFNLRVEAVSPISREDFRTYGRREGDQFLPYWRDEETFKDFTAREVGLNLDPRAIVEEAVNDLVMKSGMPISEVDKDTLSELSEILSAQEVDLLRAHALAVEDEMARSLALAYQAMGNIPAGSVPDIVNPLDNLREEAGLELIDLFGDVRSSADGVYGPLVFYPAPNTESAVVAEYKAKDVIPTEPKARSLYPHTENVCWSVTISGEARDAQSGPVRSLEPSAELVVLDREKNQAVTHALLEKKTILRYWLGAKIVEKQRGRMKDLKHIFRMVEERKLVDNAGETWPFDEPAKRL